jgi:hypothetical protein
VGASYSQVEFPKETIPSVFTICSVSRYSHVCSPVSRNTFLTFSINKFAHHFIRMPCGVWLFSNLFLTLIQLSCSIESTFPIANSAGSRARRTSPQVPVLRQESSPLEAKLTISIRREQSPEESTGPCRTLLQYVSRGIGSMVILTGAQRLQLPLPILPQQDMCVFVHELGMAISACEQACGSGKLQK